MSAQSRHRSRAAVCALVVWLSLAGGCMGTDVGNPEQDRRVALELAAWDGEAMPGALSHHVGDVRIDEAWLTLDGLEVRTFDGCNGRGESLLEGGQLVAELVSGLELPATPVAMPGSAELCRIELTPGAYAGAVDGVPEALRGASVLVRGARGDGTAFTLTVDLREPIPLQARADAGGHTRLTLAHNERRLLVAFALGNWFDDEVRRELDALDARQLEILTPLQAPALSSMLRVRIRRSVQLFRDLNQDGLLQPGEAVGPVGQVDPTAQGDTP